MDWWVGLRTGEDWMVDVDSGWGCRAGGRGWVKL